MALLARTRTNHLGASQLIAAANIAARVEICAEEHRDQWRAMAESCADSTSGHRFEWRDAIRDAYGFAAYHLVARDDSGRALAGAPFILVRSHLYGNELCSMPYIEFGGICHLDQISASDRVVIDQMILNRAVELGGRFNCKRVEVRSLRPCDGDFSVSTEKVDQFLRLMPTEAEQFKCLTSERRNRIKRCNRFELSSDVLPSSDEGALRDFFDVFAANQRDLGSPTHSIDFFRAVIRHLPDLFESFIIVRHSGVAVAAALVQKFRSALSIPWSGATLAARPLYATNALYWTAMRVGIARGCHTFDLGRSSIGSGIFEFKRQWNPKPVQTYWSTHFSRGAKVIPCNRSDLKLASKVWKRLPVSVTRMLGPALRRGISN